MNVARKEIGATGGDRQPGPFRFFKRSAMRASHQARFQASTGRGRIPLDTCDDPPDTPAC